MIRLLVKTASGFLSVDDLTHNDFLSSKLTGIHLHHPFKQIGSFQLFINTTGFGELSGDQPHLFLRRDVDVMEICIQTTPRQKCGVGAFRCSFMNARRKLPYLPIEKCVCFGRTKSG